MAQAYNVKLIQSGNVLEVYSYGEKRFRGFQRSDNYGKSEGIYHVREVDEETGEIYGRVATAEEIESIREEIKLSSRATSNQIARNKVRRLVLANFNNRSRFLTLTFRQNIQDVELASKTFERFVKYMNYDLKEEGKEFKYIAVIEFQKRGAIHFHLICDGLPMNRKGYRDKVRNRWRQAIRTVTGAEGEGVGNIDLKKISHVDNVGAYVVKYMTKAEADKRLFGKKLYRTSQGLRKPVERIFNYDSLEELEKELRAFGVEGTKKVYQSSYKDQFTEATVDYQEYNFDR
ncbi:hypothetical protein NNE64_12635 [Enterococcus faecium]|nr:hypothetical protein [Enterococcus faecium]